MCNGPHRVYRGAPRYTLKNFRYLLFEYWKGPWCLNLCLFLNSQSLILKYSTGPGNIRSKVTTDLIVSYRHSFFQALEPKPLWLDFFRPSLTAVIVCVPQSPQWAPIRATAEKSICYFIWCYFVPCFCPFWIEDRVFPRQNLLTWLSNLARQPRGPVRHSKI